MKKIYILGGLLLAAVAIATIFYLNRDRSQGGQSQSGDSADAQSQNDAGDTHNNTDRPFSSQGRAVPSKPRFDPIPTPDKAKKIDAFLTSSGMGKAFDFLDQSMTDGFAQAGAGQTEQEKEIAEVIRQKFNSKVLADEYKEVLSANFSDEELDRLNEIYQNPLLRKITEAQSADISQEGIKEQFEFRRTFKISDLAEDRLSSINVFAEHQLKNLANNLPNNMSPSERDAFYADLRKEIVIDAARRFKDNSVAEINSIIELTADPLYERETQEKIKFTMGKTQEIISLTESQNPN